MNIYLITYDLNSPGQSHAKVLEKLKQFEWAQLSESSYAVKSDCNATQIYNFFSSLLDQNDNFYVIRLTRDFSGQGPKAVNEWLGKNL